MTRRAGRPRLVAAAVVIAAAAGASAAALAVGGAGAANAGRVTTASVAAFRAALVAKLDAQSAHFYWVVCVPSGRRFHGVRVVRCNVNFGDPHIQAYCSVFRGGRLVTSADDPAIPCGHDDAGYTATIYASK